MASSSSLGDSRSLAAISCSNQTAVIQLRQHAVETAHRATELVA